MADYGMRKQVAGAFDDAVRRVREALAREGFGVLTEINVQKTLKERLGVEHPSYVILGACHPESAYQALQTEKEIGLRLPCNVIVYDDGGAVTVSAIRPTVALPVAGNAALAGLAQDVEARLSRALDSLS